MVNHRAVLNLLWLCLINPIINFNANRVIIKHHILTLTAKDFLSEVDTLIILIEDFNTL